MIPLTYLLYLYIAFTGLVVMYGVFNIFHVFRHGHLNAKIYFATILFVSVFIIALFSSYTFIYRVDFSDRLEIFQNSSFGSIPNSEF